MTDTSLTVNPLQEYRLLQFANEMLYRYDRKIPSGLDRRTGLFWLKIAVYDFLDFSLDFDELDEKLQWQALRSLEKIPTLAPAAREAVLLEVARQALGSSEALNMEHWHSDGGLPNFSGCGTSHCIAGWATTVAQDAGTLLEREFGTFIAGAMLLGPEAAAHFLDGQENGKRYLQSVLDRNA